MEHATYNESAVSLHFSLRFHRIWRFAARAKLAIVLVLAVVVTAHGQRSSQAAAPTPGKGSILLVLPFDNRTGQPSLEWIREAAPALLSSRFASAGFAPMSRTERPSALDPLG